MTNDRLRRRSGWRTRRPRHWSRLFNLPLRPTLPPHVGADGFRAERAHILAAQGWAEYIESQQSVNSVNLIGGNEDVESV